MMKSSSIFSDNDLDQLKASTEKLIEEYNVYGMNVTKIRLKILRAEQREKKHPTEKSNLPALEVELKSALACLEKPEVVALQKEIASNLDKIKATNKILFGQTFEGSPTMMLPSSEIKGYKR